MITTEKGKVTESEGIERPCKCNADLVEGSLAINGNKVRFYKCPACGAFAYHSGDLQTAVYRQAPEEGIKREW